MRNLKSAELPARVTLRVGLARGGGAAGSRARERARAGVRRGGVAAGGAGGRAARARQRRALLCRRVAESGIASRPFWLRSKCSICSF